MTESSPPGAGVGLSPVVLVVDDEPYIVRAVSYALTMEGIPVETSADGEAGLAQARALRPAVLVLDIMMPRMDGYAVCEQIRQDPALAGMWIIMLSAKGQQVDRERGLLGGASEYLTKPFSPSDLVARVRAALGRSSAASGEASSP